MHIKSILAALSFIFIAQFALTQSSNYKGIGIAFGPSVYCDGYFQVNAVLPDGPADRAGIKKDYCLIAVDGKDLKDVPQREIVDLIKGPEGTTVTITISWDGERDIEVYRGDIDPEQFLLQANKKWIDDRTVGDGPYARFFEQVFNGLNHLAEAAEDHFEGMMDEVDYSPFSMKRIWELNERFTEKYGMRGELYQNTPWHFKTEVRIAAGLSKDKQGANSFRNHREVIKYWIDKKLIPEGFVVTEYKNDEKDLLHSYFLHRPGDTGEEFHQHPQIRIVFSGTEEGEKKIMAQVYSPYSQFIQDLAKNDKDPRIDRGSYDAERATDCLSGDCINGFSSFEVRRQRDDSVIFTYTGEMKNGLAHGKGKVEEEGTTSEGIYWKGKKDGTQIHTTSWGEVIHERYDKGKYISGDSKEMAEALERQKRKEFKPDNTTTSSGSGGGYHKIAGRSASSIPSPPAGVNELVQSMIQEGYMLVDQVYLSSADYLNGPYMHFKAMQGQEYLAIAAVGSGNNHPHMEVVNLSRNTKKPDEEGQKLNSAGYKIKFMKFNAQSESGFTMKVNMWPDEAGRQIWGYLLMR